MIVSLAFFLKGIHFWYMFNEAFGREERSHRNKRNVEVNEAMKKKNRPYFPLNPDWLIGILNDWFPIHNPLITGQYNPLYTLDNQGHYVHFSIDLHQSSRAFPFVKVKNG